MMLSRPVVMLLLVCATAHLAKGWFFECDELEPEEYEKKKDCWTTTKFVSTDSTPTTSTKKPGKKSVQDKTKRVMRGLMFQMRQKRFTFQLGNVSVQQQVLEGMFVFLECPGADRDSKHRRKLRWFFSGMEIGTDFLSWRIKQNYKRQLELWPTFPGDSGLFECYLDDEWQGQISLLVISLRDAIHIGIINFFYTVPFAALMLAMMIGQLLFCLYRPPKPIVDPMVEFNEKQLALTDKEYSERITETVHDDERKMKSGRSEVAPRSASHAIKTLMLIERPPALSKPIVVTSQPPIKDARDKN